MGVAREVVIGTCVKDLEDMIYPDDSSSPDNRMGGGSDTSTLDT